ncbi:MAG: LolA family protein [Sphingorhabdus sp.]
MTFKAFSLFSVPLLATVAVALPASAQTSNDLSQVISHMQAVSTMSASFTQTDRNNQSVGGKLLLKRPGHVKFEYEKNVPLLIVADGRALTMIDYEVKQVQRWPIRNSPLAALLDPGKDLARFGKRVPTNNANVVSVEVRDPKRPEYGTMTLIFTKQSDAPGGLTLNGWVALDSKNNRTTVRLNGIRYNQSIAQSNFTWRDPRPRKKL